MSKSLSLIGNISCLSWQGRPGSTRQFPLLVNRTVAQSFYEGFDLSSTLLSPFVASGPLPAGLVALRVLSGGPVTVILTGPGGADQATQVSELFVASSWATPFTAVKLVGTASVEMMIASST